MKISVTGIVPLLFFLASAAWADIAMQGDDAYQSGQFLQARQTYLQVARDSGATSYSAAARYRAAMCHYDLKEYDAFQTEATALLRQHAGQHIEKTVAMKHRLAQLPFIKGQWAESVDSLGKFLAEYPRCQYTFDALNNRAKALCKLNRYQEARQAYLEYIRSFKSSPYLERAKFRAALCLYQMEEYAAFTGEAQAVLSQYPNNVSEDAEWLKLHLAQVPGKQGDWEKTVEQLEQVLQANPKITLEHAQIDCGQAYLMAAAKLAKRGAPQKTKLFESKGVKYLQQAREALKAQIAGGRKKADNADVRTMVLESYLHEKDFSGLSKAAEALVKESPARSLLWAKGNVFLGVARLNLNPAEADGAAAAFDAVIQANVEDPNVKEHIPTAALYWRAVVAQQRKHDDSQFHRAIEGLKAMPEGPLKKAAQARFAIPAR